ncbi:MAG TPA: glycosyltransferase family 2 protein [Lunatimonas sp.]|nr:glycosyltransferase family 2 protein [Lunatimonas sp.]
MKVELVSIITPLHNSGKFISKTIDSVLAQSYTNFELIVVDDCSNDNGPSIINKYLEKDNRIRFYRNMVNSGPAFSRNKAIEMANGRFIAFLDSDDVWYPEKLETQISFMLKHGYAFTFSSYDKMSEDGVYKGRVKAPVEVTYENLVKTCSVGCLTAVYDVSLLGKVFMPEIKKRQDFALWLKILKIIPKGYGIHRPLAKYRVRNNSISGNKWKASRYQWEVYRKVEKMNLFQSAYFFSFYTINGILKTYFK